jgi:hypothetical protein
MQDFALCLVTVNSNWILGCTSNPVLRNFAVHICCCSDAFFRANGGWNCESVYKSDVVLLSFNVYSS